MLRPSGSVHLALFGVIAALSPPARAQLDEPVEVRVQSALPCTDALDFFERVRRRAPMARRAARGESARVFTIGAEPGGTAVRGHLVVNHLDGSQSSRTLEGGSCDEVVDALALVVALDIDPRAAGSSAPAPTALALALALAPAARREPYVPPAPVPVDDSLSWRFDAGASLAIARGIVPVSLISLPVYVELSHRSLQLFSPSFALGFERTFNARVVGDRGDAMLHVVQGFGQLCPIAWTSGPARVSPCVRVDVGALEGAGEVGKQVVTPRQERRVWAAVGGVARLTVRVYRGLQFDAQLGVGTPIVPRYELQLDPAEPLGRVDAWHWRAGIGLRLRFL